jgi:pimeloyl-ACP methyl ester carboxylesterase
MTLEATISRPERGSANGIGFLRRHGQDCALPLVLLHGIGSNASSFAPLISALPATLDIVAWNAPGYISSTPLEQPSPAPRDYAVKLLDLLDALKLDRIALCGHSLGALFAGSFARLHPERVTALALISPALGYRVPPGDPLPPSVQARIDDIMSEDIEAFAAKRAPRLVHAPERNPSVVAAVRDAMTVLHPGGYAQAVRALGAGDLVADAAFTTAPSVVAVGAEDVITPPANARSVQSALRNAVAFHEVTGAGHALPQQSPAALAQILTQMLERVHG